MPTKLFAGLGGAALFAAAVFASPAAAEDTAQEKANKQVVLDFYAALNEGDATGTTAQRIPQIAERYLSPSYTQHRAEMKSLPGEGSDRDKLIRMFQTMPAMPSGPAAMPKTIAVMAEGDLVMMLTSRTMTNPATGQATESFIFNMFRVEGGKLTEHWDVMSGSGGPPPGMGGPGGPGGPPPGGVPGLPPGGPPPGAP